MFHRVHHDRRGTARNDRESRFIPFYYNNQRAVNHIIGSSDLPKTTMSINQCGARADSINCSDSPRSLTPFHAPTFPPIHTHRHHLDRHPLTPSNHHHHRRRHRHYRLHSQFWWSALSEFWSVPIHFAISAVAPPPPSDSIWTADS